MKPTQRLRRMRPVLASLFALAALSCSGDSPTGGSGRVPAALRLAGGDLTLGEQESASLSASVLDQDGQAFATPPAGLTIAWSSSDPAVATVADGRVTGNRAGQAWARARAGSLGDSVRVTVRAAAAALELVKGGDQRGVVGAPLRDTVVLRVVDRGGNPVGGVDVSVSVTAGGGSIAGVGGGGVGTIRMVWTLGTRAGDNTLTAGVAGVPPLVVRAVGTPGPVTRFAIAPDTATLEVGEARQFTAAPVDAYGNAVAGAAPAWTTSSPGIATVDAAGRVTGRGTGIAQVAATLDGRTALAAVNVVPAAASVVIYSPAPGPLVVGATVQLAAAVRDAAGNGLNRPVSWSSSDSAVARVGPTGTVITRGAGSATITAASGQGRATVALQVAVLRLASLDAGGQHSCGLTADGTAFCWGADETGQLGAGYTAYARPVPAGVVGGHRFARVWVGGGANGLSDGHSCGLTSAGKAFCWGHNRYGQLGNGAYTWEQPYGESRPVAVGGGISFASLAVGDAHTCGLTASGRAYCWGSNENGRLGSPSGGSACVGGVPCTLAPREVSGAPALVSLVAGLRHTCGLTAEGAAYCWGDNAAGQLGSGTTVASQAPVAVAGGLRFRELSPTSGSHTCGVTTAGAAYCWGAGSAGQLGTGFLTNQPAPSPVAGGGSWRSLEAGASFTCGMRDDGLAFCWGDNTFAQFGDGSRTSSASPVPAAGGMALARLAAGSSHACGTTAAGVTWCWGINGMGNVGDGTTVDRSRPVKVYGQP